MAYYRCIEGADPAHRITVCLKDIPWNTKGNLSSIQVHSPPDLPIQKHADFIQKSYFSTDKKVIILDGSDNRVYHSTSKKGDS